MKFDDVPRLPKLPFILADIALLVVAAFIATRHPNPFSPLPLFLITACVAVGCAAFVIPIVVNYVRDQEEAAASLRHELGEQFKRLMAASEHLQHSTAQLKTIEEIATKNLQAAEKLPYRLQEKIAEFQQQLAESENEEKEALEQELGMLRSSESERLAAVVDKIAKTTAEWSKLEASGRQHLGDAARLEQKLAGVLLAVEEKIAALEKMVQAAATISPPPAILPPPVPAVVAPPPAVPVARTAPAELAPTTLRPDSVEPPQSVAPAADPAVVIANADALAVTPKPPRKPRVPKKLRPEDTSSAALPRPEPGPAEPPPDGPAAAAETPLSPITAPTAGAAGDLVAEPVADETPAAEDFSQVPPDEIRPVAAPTADGQTRLTVVSYIGIGNKLYLRGVGPGLNWDKGVPLQFVSIGRWRWETGEATAPVTCKVYKNDKVEAPLGLLTLAPGTEQEITAAF